MEKYSTEYFRHLANDIMFDLSDDEIKQLQEDFTLTIKEMSLLEKINTDDVEEMIYPFEEPTSFLRTDEVNHVISQSDALKNAPKVSEGQIVVPKVVK